MYQKYKKLVPSRSLYINKQLSFIDGDYPLVLLPPSNFPDEIMSKRENHSVKLTVYFIPSKNL